MLLSASLLQQARIGQLLVWRSVNNIFAWSYLGCRHPAYLRGGVPRHVGFLRPKNVIAMSWSPGLSLRLETADVDYRSGCRG
jgi:hypothetical protein